MENSQSPQLEPLVQPQLKKTSPIFLVLAIGGILVAIGLLVMAGVMYMRYAPSSSPLPSGEVACTLDAKICPDGTAVGRIGPNCEFAACPTEEMSMRVCPKDLFNCPDGSLVGRTGPKCEFVCGGLPVGESEPAVGWQSYSSQKYKYSFQYPKTWSFFPYDEDNPAVKGGAHSMASYDMSVNGVEKYMDHGVVDWKAFLGDKPALKLDIFVQDVTVEARAEFENSLLQPGITGTPVRLSSSDLQIDSLSTTQTQVRVEDGGELVGSTYFAYPNTNQVVVITVSVSNAPNNLSATAEWQDLVRIFQSFKFNL